MPEGHVEELRPTRRIRRALAFTGPIHDYIAANSGQQVNSDIWARWQDRIVAQKMNLRGADGAEEYLRKYGNGIGHSKASKLACVASAQGCDAMAKRFWEEAYFLLTGVRASVSSPRVVPRKLVAASTVSAFGNWAEIELNA